MKKAVICVLLLCVALGVGACGEIGAILNQLPKKEAQTETMDQTQAGDSLIDEVGDMTVGFQPGTEIDLIVADEDATEGATETETMAANQTADPEAGETAKKKAAETTETGKRAKVNKAQTKEDGRVKTEEAQTEEDGRAEKKVSAQTGKDQMSETETEKSPETETESETQLQGGPVIDVVSEYLSSREAMGEQWSVAYEDLETGEKYGYQEEDIMQSASVVKLFIMGAVYRYMCYPKEGETAIPFHEEYDGQLRDTIVSMITVSDNSCANLLIERLGEGDFGKGAGLIREFCEENGYTGTSIGRRFMEENPSGDNYTTSADSRKFLSDLYHKKLVTEEASAKMLEIVKGQTLRNKIPAGLPSGFTSGNKTGEMPEGYGLGCIENDSAIVFAPEGMGEGYILTVMSNRLGGRNSEAISLIVQISSKVAKWYIEQHS